MPFVRSAGHAVVAEVPLRDPPWKPWALFGLGVVAACAYPIATTAWDAATASARAEATAALPPPAVVVADEIEDPRVALALIQARVAWSTLEAMTEPPAWETEAPPAPPEVLAEARRCTAPDVHPRDMVCDGLNGALALRMLARAGEYTPELTARVGRRVVLDELGAAGAPEVAAFLEEAGDGWRGPGDAEALLLRREAELRARRAPRPEATLTGDGWAPVVAAVGLALGALAALVRLARWRRSRRIEVEGWGLRLGGERVPASELVGCEVLGDRLILRGTAGDRVEGPFDALRSELEEVAEAIRSVIPSEAEREAAEAKAREVAEAHAGLSQALKDRGR